MRRNKRKAHVLYFSAAVLSLLFSEGSTAYAEEKWTWPTSGHISDYFGTRKGKHFGIDIAAKTGTAILAAKGGIVTKSYYSQTYGHVVFIKHEDGYEAVYAHMSKRMANVGKRVASGEKIGEVGNTGHSRGAHLHFEVHKGSWNIHKTNAINPLVVLNEDEVEAVASTYVVQEGDTLSKIASRFGLTVRQLKVKNQLHNDIILPKQRLVLN
ncbi:peptidoglycan DD-metalloendopeptidase family protein [Bacillus sp. 165]|uniref:peptidoglycan DD-metalloendopeptidase family protein n=1 Tax=Bacillus sp. 165 TaxID=1529117 RepID=UPI001ADD4078|nr:peptidoglycan DD-metalloendopeptidase family protein [Bacillus sp. 165]MBO9128279.1 peptidoglycan DD-metalloendopeptidase family protein [Bacillus sp. 165]